MVIVGYENGLPVTMRRFYGVLWAAIALTISGCATTVELGQTALREGRYSDAASRFETALQEHPERTDALVGLGITRYEQARYDDAVAQLSQAVSKDPKSADAQLYLGLSYLERGDENSAVERLRAFRDLTHSARVAEQVDAALRLMRAKRSLSAESRHFIAVSLESAMKAQRELKDARWAYEPSPPDYGYRDSSSWGWSW